MNTLMEVAEELRILDRQFVHQRDNTFARMADIVEGVIKHAEEIRDHAWLARFTKADYDNRCNELSPDAAREIAGYINTFLDKIKLNSGVTEYRCLRKGEIIEEGDEVDVSTDGWRDEPVWKPIICVGQEVPDPQYPAHRQYRRKVKQ